MVLQLCVTTAMEVNIYLSTTGSYKVGIGDYVFGLGSPFTINRRTASPANDWELMFGGAFFTPNMIASATETNSIRANAGVLSFAGDTVFAVGGFLIRLLI